MASRAFMRGAGFNGHLHTIQHEVILLERVAADKHGKRETRDKTQTYPHLAMGASRCDGCNEVMPI